MFLQALFGIDDLPVNVVKDGVAAWEKRLRRLYKVGARYV